MNTEAMLKEAYSKASYLCSRQEKCSSEIREKLKNWGLDRSEQNQVLKKLVEERFIDNERFAAAFVREKLSINKWGRQKIIFMLKSKGIDSETIEKALDENISENYAESLQDLLSKKMRSLKYKDQYDLKNKLLRFGYSRGFESDVLDKAIRQLVAGVEE